MKKYLGLGYAVIVETWFTLLEEWRLMLAIMGMIGVGVWSFVNGWWFNPGQVWLWHIVGPYLPVRITSMYWLGVAAAVMGMVGFHNEVGISRKWKAVGMSLLVGLMLMMMGPVGTMVTIPGGLLWVGFDLVPSFGLWRKRIIIWLLIGSLGLSSLLMWKTIRYRGFVAPVGDWQRMARLIKSTRVKYDHIRCVGCADASELWPLEVWLKEYGVNKVRGEKEIYVTLTGDKSNIANTVRYSVGKINLHIPLKDL